MKTQTNPQKLSFGPYSSLYEKLNKGFVDIAIANDKKLADITVKIAEGNLAPLIETYFPGETGIKYISVLTYATNPDLIGIALMGAINQAALGSPEAMSKQVINMHLLGETAVTYLMQKGLYNKNFDQIKASIDFSQLEENEAALLDLIEYTHSRKYTAFDNTTVVSKLGDFLTDNAKSGTIVPKPKYENMEQFYKSLTIEFVNDLIAKDKICQDVYSLMKEGNIAKIVSDYIAKGDAEQAEARVNEFKQKFAEPDKMQNLETMFSFFVLSKALGGSVETAVQNINLYLTTSATVAYVKAKAEKPSFNNAEEVMAAIESIKNNTPSDSMSESDKANLEFIDYTTKLPLYEELNDSVLAAQIHEYFNHEHA